MDKTFFSLHRCLTVESSRLCTSQNVLETFLIWTCYGRDIFFSLYGRPTIEIRAFGYVPGRSGNVLNLYHGRDIPYFTWTSGYVWVCLRTSWKRFLPLLKECCIWRFPQIVYKQLWITFQHQCTFIGRILLEIFTSCLLIILWRTFWHYCTFIRRTLS